METFGTVGRAHKRIFGGSAAVLVLLVSVFAAVILPVYATSGDLEKFKPGDTAPDFSLQDISGAAVSLSSYAGKKVVLLNFFSLRCGTCLAEAPYLETIHKKYDGDDMVLLAVNIDGVDAQIASETMRDVGMDVTYNVLLDTEFLATDTYTNFQVPLTLVIDKKGIVRYIHTGFKEGDEKGLEKAVRKSFDS